MAVRGPNNRENTYLSIGGAASGYKTDSIAFYGGANITLQTEDGGKETFEVSQRQAKPSIFNRYCLFYFNNKVLNNLEPEEFFDKPNESSLSGTKNSLSNVIKNPTAANLIKWSNEGAGDHGTNAVEYDWSDFLWCKNYGTVPNNYMITLRRFSIPANDDLFSNKRQPTPDIARMVTWVDGETNTWESAGLKFKTSMNWKKLTSEIQSIDASDQSYGDEGSAVGGGLGNIIKQALYMTQKGSGKSSLGSPQGGVDPTSNANKVHGPINVIKEVNIRDTGLEFEQSMTLTFEYELRSIDGINPKVAMIDLLSNVLTLVANKGSFWGGDIRYYGGSPRRIQPLGKPDLLAKGDTGGYLKSLMEGISGRVKDMTGGKGFSYDGLLNAAKNIGGNLMDSIIGGGLDKAGRPGIHAMNSLLSGADTGDWHVMIGNPANPIASIGNLILKSTDIELNGALNMDDFPTKLKVICTLEPARPRDRSDILSMFHRGARTYTQIDVTNKQFSYNIKTRTPDDKNTALYVGGTAGNQVVDGVKETDISSMKAKFGNWKGEKDNDILIKTANGIH